jgi:two-component system, cell cycle sensor histidine kinase and response regulator CckA
MSADAPAPAILLVDDDPFIRGVMRTYLTNHGYRVLLADCGTEALRLSAEFAGPIDLVITDLMMPGMSGRELVRRLLPGRPRLRVIYMSGYSDESLANDEGEDVMSIFLAKPFTMTELSHTVAALLSSH